MLKNDGQVIIGTIKDRSGGNVIIKPLGGEEIVISSTEIKDLEALKTSIMPERIIELLSEQEIRDLFAYLGK